MALRGQINDGHTFANVIPHVEATIGNGISRILIEAVYNFRVILNGRRLFQCLTDRMILLRSSGAQQTSDRLKSECSRRTNKY